MTTATLFEDARVAEAYGDHRGVTDERFVDEVARALGPVRGPVADVGAGTGAPAEALARRGYEVVAVEPSRAMIAQGRTRNPSVRFVRASGEELPLADGSCGGAVMLYVLHHASDPEAVLAETGRVVRVGGCIVVVCGRQDCARQRLFGRYFPTLVPDLPDTDEISLYARAAGLGLVDVRTVEHWIYPHRRIDENYVRMVEAEMFATLRSLNEPEFAAGVERLRSDVGRPLPPARVSLLVLER